VNSRSAPDSSRGQGGKGPTKPGFALWSSKLPPVPVKARGIGRTLGEKIKPVGRPGSSGVVGAWSGVAKKKRRPSLEHLARAPRQLQVRISWQLLGTEHSRTPGFNGLAVSGDFEGARRRAVRDEGRPPPAPSRLMAVAVLRRPYPSPVSPASLADRGARRTTPRKGESAGEFLEGEAICRKQALSAGSTFEGRGRERGFERQAVRGHQFIGRGFLFQSLRRWRDPLDRLGQWRRLEAALVLGLKHLAVELAMSPRWPVTLSRVVPAHDVLAGEVQARLIFGRAFCSRPFTITFTSITMVEMPVISP